jgi:hypothetical protein
MPDIEWKRGSRQGKFMDLEWLQTNWVIAAAASGGALLVLILLIVALAGFGKRAKPAGKKANAAVRPASKPATGSAQKTAAAGMSPSAASAAPPASAPFADKRQEPSGPRVSLVLDLGASKPEDWKTPSGEAATAVPSPSGLRVAAATGAVSATSAPAQPGDLFACDYEVRLVEASPNGAPVNFHVGPVMRDAAGTLISYWLEQPPLTPDQPVRRGSIEVRAPEGTATVHLGVHGSWRADGQHGTAPVEFTHLALRQK